jgi:hypothetical protein
MDRRPSARQAAVGVCLSIVLVLSAALGAAAYLDDAVPASGEISLQTNTGATVTVPVGSDGEIDPTFLNDSAVDVASNRGNVTVRGPGDASVTVDEYANSPWSNVTALDVDANNITVAVEDRSPLTVGGAATSAGVREDARLNDGTPDAAITTTGGASTLTIRSLAVTGQVAAVNQSGTILDVTSATSGTVTFDIPAGEHTIYVRSTQGAPALSNPAPEGELSSAPDTLYVNVTDADLPDDNVTLVWRLDGTVVNTTFATENGRYETPVNIGTVGQHTASVAATDEFGQTRTINWTFGSPANLSVRSTEAGNPYINTQEVTLTFTRGDTVVRRTTSTGNVSLSGLPAKGSLIVRAETSGYITRRTVIRNLAEQQSIYLAPDTASTVAVQFKLTDRSGGSFDPTDTRLIIQRAINQSDGSLAYRSVAGGTFGAANQYTIDLVQDEDYRLQVLSDSGEMRVLGSYTAAEPGVEELSVGRFEVNPDTDSGTATRLETVEMDSDGDGDDERFLRVGYRDPDRASDEVAFTIRNEQTGSVIASEQVNVEGISKYVATYQVSANDTDTTYLLNYSVSRDGTVKNGTKYAGGVVAPFEDIPLDPRWYELLGMTAIAATGGLVVIVNGALGAFAATAIASLLTLMGVVAIPSAALGLAGAVAVLALFGRDGP